MPNIREVVECLEQFAPAALAEDWDNVGLLVGEGDWPADRIMTCLTVTPASVNEAIQHQAQLIVSHHPLPFRPLKTITDSTTAGKLLLRLISAKVGVYSPHTAFDSAQAGINQHLAIGLGLQEIQPLVPSANHPDSELGTGRFGTLGEVVPLVQMALRVKNFLGIENLRIVGDDDQSVSRVAIACGSGGALLPAALAKECDCFITGETTFHTCLEAAAQRIGLVLPGHFASERFALLSLADYLGDLLHGVDVWTCRTEHDPLRNV